MGFEIRTERGPDASAIADVHRLAFGDQHVVELVERIRQSDRFVAELSLVAAEHDSVIGHVMLSYADLVRSGDAVPVLLLSPLGVRPDRQRRGVGTALMHEAITRVRGRNEPLVIVEGIPSFYPRFGFRPARRCGIEPPYPLPDEVFMMLPLAGYHPSHRGRLVYPTAFDVVAP